MLRGGFQHAAVVEVDAIAGHMLDGEPVARLEVPLRRARALAEHRVVVVEAVQQQTRDAACLRRQRSRAGASRLQRPVEKRQAHVHPIVDVRSDCRRIPRTVWRMPASARRSDSMPRAVVDVVLVAPAAIDVDSLERLEVAACLPTRWIGIVLQPFAPARFERLAGLEVERQPEAERRLRVRDRRSPPCRRS